MVDSRLRASKTAECRDCKRRMLTEDMKQDGRGDWFCPTCYAAGVARAKRLGHKH